LWKGWLTPYYAVTAAHNLDWRCRRFVNRDADSIDDDSCSEPSAGEEERGALALMYLPFAAALIQELLLLTAAGCVISRIAPSELKYNE
jgi:hypothetical protein